MISRFALTVAALLCVGSVSAAQDSRPAEPPAKAVVTITAVKASGKKSGKLALPPELEALRGLLLKFDYGRYQKLVAPTVTGAQGAALVFELAEGHTATVIWSDHDKPGGDLQLAVTLEKPAADPKQGKVKVATMKIRLKDGATFPIKVPEVYAHGDLLLLVSATREKAATPPEKD